MKTNRTFLDNINEILQQTEQYTAGIIQRRYNKTLLEKRQDEFLSANDNLNDWSLVYKIFLFLMSLCWFFSAYIDFIISRNLWQDLVGSTSVVAVLPAAALVTFAILASAMIGEPVHPLLTRRSLIRYRMKITNSASGKFLERHSKIKWAVAAFGIIIGIGLIIIMSVASHTRVIMELTAGILNFGSAYQTVIPPILMFLEIVTGIFLLQFVLVCHFGVKKRFYEWRVHRFNRKCNRNMNEIKIRWKVIQDDIQTCREENIKLPRLNISPNLNKILEEIFGIDNAFTFSDSIPPQAERHLKENIAFKVTEVRQKNDNTKGIQPEARMATNK